MLQKLECFRWQRLVAILVDKNNHVALTAFKFLLWFLLHICLSFFIELAHFTFWWLVWLIIWLIHWAICLRIFVLVGKRFGVTIAVFFLFFDSLDTFELMTAQGPLHVDIVLRWRRLGHFESVSTNFLFLAYLRLFYLTWGKVLLLIVSMLRSLGNFRSIRGEIASVVLLCDFFKFILAPRWLAVIATLEIKAYEGYVYGSLRDILYTTRARDRCWRDVIDWRKLPDSESLWAVVPIFTRIVVRQIRLWGWHHRIFALNALKSAIRVHRQTLWVPLRRGNVWILAFVRW